MGDANESEEESGWGGRAWLVATIDTAIVQRKGGTCYVLKKCVFTALFVVICDIGAGVSERRGLRTAWRAETAIKVVHDVQTELLVRPLEADGSAVVIRRDGVVSSEALAVVRWMRIVDGQVSFAHL